MPRQSTNHVLLIKPSSFYCNEQTSETNLYQHSSQGQDKDKILSDALTEFHDFEQLLKKINKLFNENKQLLQKSEQLFKISEQLLNFFEKYYTKK